MPRPFGQALRIGIAGDGIAMVRICRWRAGHTVLSERRVDAELGLAAIALALRELLAELGRGGWPISIVLSDDLVRMWCVTPPPACSRMADLVAAAGLRFKALFGDSAAGWKIAADWQASTPFLAAAVPGALISVIEQAARDHRCHLVEIVPQFVAAMNQCRRLRRPGAWFGALYGQALTIAAFDGPALAAVRTAAVPLLADRGWLESLVAREALRLGLARPDSLQLSGAAPGAWVSHPGRLKFSCSLLDADAARDMPATVRLACTGRSA